MKKHLNFRKDYKVLLKVNIDTPYYYVTRKQKMKNNLRFKILLKYIDADSEIGINNIF